MITATRSMCRPCGQIDPASCDGTIAAVVCPGKVGSSIRAYVKLARYSGELEAFEIAEVGLSTDACRFVGVLKSPARIAIKKRSDCSTTQGVLTHC